MRPAFPPPPPHSPSFHALSTHGRGPHPRALHCDPQQRWTYATGNWTFFDENGNESDFPMALLDEDNVGFVPQARVPVIFEIAVVIDT